MTEALPRLSDTAMVNRQNVEALRARIVQRYEGLSPRLKQVAAYALEHPNDIGLETLAVIAKRCKVQPSTIVRFAKTFGYDGASEMQKLFRDEFLSLAPSPSYADRIRQFNERAGDVASQSPSELLREFTDGNIAALQHLNQTTRQADLERGVRLIAEAESVYLVGLRRSFPVAAYLAYALRHADKRAYLVDGLAGMMVEQSSMLGPKDLLIATSFRPYAQQTATSSTSAARARRPRHRDQRQPALADRAQCRPLLRGQGRGVPQVPLADGVALPRADAGDQLRLPADGRRASAADVMKTFALFGAGRIGRIHAANIRAHAGARLKYVVDVAADAARESPRRRGATHADAGSRARRPRGGRAPDREPDRHACRPDRGRRRCRQGDPLRKAGRSRRRACAALRRRGGTAGILLAIGFNRRYDPSFRRSRPASTPARSATSSPC